MFRGGMPGGGHGQPRQDPRRGRRELGGSDGNVFGRVPPARRTMYPGVKSVEPAEGHKLILVFDDGAKRVFDAKPLLNFGRFRSLASDEAFRKVRVSFDTVEWKDGLDIDPEYLYENSQPLSN